MMKESVPAVCYALHALLKNGNRRLGNCPDRIENALVFSAFLAGRCRGSTFDAEQQRIRPGLQAVKPPLISVDLLTLPCEPQDDAQATPPSTRIQTSHLAGDRDPSGAARSISSVPSVQSVGRTLLRHRRLPSQAVLHVPHTLFPCQSISTHGLHPGGYGNVDMVMLCAWELVDERWVEKHRVWADTWATNCLSLLDRGFEM